MEAGLRLDPDEIRRAVRAALDEDIGSGDVTSEATIPETANATAFMVARQRMVVAGIEFAETAFQGSKLTRHLRDGELAAKGAKLLTIQGNARAILAAERVALNFVQRLSGIATLTEQFVEAIAGTRAEILDTRKTTPGWRKFEKYAVRCGGGKNHRLGLYDMVLIKDNHLAAVGGDIARAVQRARTRYPSLQIEVEADTLEQASKAAEAGADIILLDNMTTRDLRKAVDLVKGRCKTEASGGVTLATVRAIAETGVDYISVGALTHSAPAADIGLDFESGEA
ncbi:MAG TPA: carboxylating nicotinate-nucleotide diphosphorylase [Verrucomicrobiae bacterium]|nr:carboxylating nicotinate-nucleotide diphosphorylase [Verrucomicrobiae bacterium]